MIATSPHIQPPRLFWPEGYVRFGFETAGNSMHQALAGATSLVSLSP
jgi:hypothetical protein